MRKQSRPLNGLSKMALKLKLFPAMIQGLSKQLHIALESLGPKNAIDLSTLDRDDVRRVADSYTVFGRVKPNQKRSSCQKTPIAWPRCWDDRRRR